MLVQRQTRQTRSSSPAGRQALSDARTRPFSRQRTATAFGACLAFLVSLQTSCATTASTPIPPESTPPPQAVATVAITNTGPYMRVSHPDTNTLTLQIALRQFVPAQGSGTGPDLWLTAVSHIGESNYFRSLQTFLDGRTLVLFEGVGFEEARRMKAAARTDASATPDDSFIEDEATGGSSLQSTLAASLGLAFQLEAIDYDRTHFKNSDMSIAQIQSLMVRQLKEGGLENTARTNPEFLALMAAMEGSSWFGAVLHIGVKLLGTSPKLQAMTRLMLIEMLGGIKGDMSQMKGLPPDIQDLLRVLIQERNGVVMKDVKDSLKPSRAEASIAVFYGAAHMDDMERRIVSELNYRPGKVTWLDAITVQPRLAGLSELEIMTVRSLVQWQMETLNEAAEE